MNIALQDSLQNLMMLEVNKFLSRRPTFWARNFTYGPDRAHKKWVVKTKVYDRSRHN